MNPLARLGLRFLGLLLLVLTSGVVGYQIGEERATELADRARAEVSRQAELRWAERNQQERQREVEHEQQIADLRSEFAARINRARAENERKLADLRSGHDRLRLPVTGCSGGGAGTSPAEASSEGADGTASADVAPETAAALYDIAADGDAAIEQLTALQQWAKEAVKLCSTSY